ncbi:hypothetical protein [Helicobacter canis]|uniref:Outer membrane protein n=1 Tax=Helicobacter canis TaxID=29419 RepID=A0A5M9QWM0_9HELI|nr:hypothetical protein [Helicobacter canis]KAA8711485.1 hypothetical protein F4V45_00460 [Helicobacter canis]
MLTTTTTTTAKSLAARALCVALGASLVCSLAFGAKDPNKAYKSLKSSQSSFTKNFASGSIVSGSTYGSTSKNAARRWYIFNEASVGGSYTTLGQANYVAVDVGYHAYLRTIESTILGLNFLIGAELNFPIYLQAQGSSNIIANKPLETKETAQAVQGWGVELPAMIGFEKNGFYLVGLVGYAWQFMTDTYTRVNGRGEHPTIKTNYDGLIYGAGVGYKVRNVINLGFRWTMGNMTNRKAGTEFSQGAITDGLDQSAITTQTGRDIYNIDYMKFMGFVSVVF